MQQIQTLYAIERQAGEEELDAAGLLALRQKEALPVPDTLFQWLTVEYDWTLPRSSLGNAIRYTLKREKH